MEEGHRGTSHTSTPSASKVWRFGKAAECVSGLMSPRSHPNTHLNVIRNKIRKIARRLGIPPPSPPRGGGGGGGGAWGAWGEREWSGILPHPCGGGGGLALPLPPLPRALPPSRPPAAVGGRGGAGGLGAWGAARVGGDQGYYPIHAGGRGGRLFFALRKSILPSFPLRRPPVAILLWIGVMAG